MPLPTLLPPMYQTKGFTWARYNPGKEEENNLVISNLAEIPAKPDPGSLRGVGKAGCSGWVTAGMVSWSRKGAVKLQPRVQKNCDLLVPNRPVLQSSTQEHWQSVCSLKC